MREIFCFIPENLEELKECIGKPIGVYLSENSYLETLVYSGVIKNGENLEHEFLQQGVSETEGTKYYMETIWGWRIDPKNMKFRDHGLIFSGGYKRIRTYKPNEEDYENKLIILKKNKLWK